MSISLVTARNNFFWDDDKKKKSIMEVQRSENQTEEPHFRFRAKC
jgi:hypothetical protein